MGYFGDLWCRGLKAWIEKEVKPRLASLPIGHEANGRIPALIRNKASVERRPDNLLDRRTRECQIQFMIPAIALLALQERFRDLPRKVANVGHVVVLPGTTYRGR